jgi:hypothetical protein
VKLLFSNKGAKIKVTKKKEKDCWCQAHIPLGQTIA